MVADIDALLMILPGFPSATSFLAKAWATKNTPLVFISITLSHSSGVTSRADLCKTTPALLNSTSRLQKSSTILSIVLATCSGFVTLQIYDFDLTP